MSSGTMTKLQAINKMLRGIGVQRASALDTGTTSLVGEAEAVLDEVTQEVQAEGWTVGTTTEYEYKIPDVVIAISGGAGTFIFDETVTESVSLATGQYKFSGASMYLVGLTGTFTGGQTLTGSLSGATRTGAAYSAQTESPLFVNTTWTRVVPNRIEPLRIVKRGDQLYDETNQTATFKSSVYLDVTRELFFTDLSYGLAMYVAARAAIDFQRYKKRGRVDDAILKDELKAAYGLAIAEEEDLRRTNTLGTDDVTRIKGSRHGYQRGIW